MFPLCCPKCGLPLKKEGNGCQCSEGHRYDLARSGYVNLLLANGKHSLQPGDDKRMVRARRLFLEKDIMSPSGERCARRLLSAFRWRGLWCWTPDAARATIPAGWLRL